ncbi:Signal transduction histidine kinase [Agrococcus baldri]|uniref:histidine kinase n=1 Tax=Agrococcus baldri TaxID=153730 RepID=A0AA94HNG8_9MICO|nr:histidine kinase [Agrococcus baldri]SFS15598.1 Signal transduction histidine kinase [Agrococcus baldri]
MSTLTGRARWLLAAAAGLWAGVLAALDLDERWWLAVPIGAWFAGASLLLADRPWHGVAATIAGVLAVGWIGLPSENAAPLGAIVIALAVIGAARPRSQSIWAVPLLLTATAVAAGWSAPSIVFGAALLVLPWWFGSLVRKRDLARRAAAQHELELSLADPVSLARSAAASEHEAVSAATLAVIGRAVDAMSATAGAARAELPAASLDAIHVAGGEASQRLRSLLALLREPGAAAETARAPQPPTARARPWPLTLLASTWPALLMLLDVALLPVLMREFGETPAVPAPTWPFVLLGVAPLAVAVALRRWSVLALLGASATLVATSTAGIVDVGRDGLWLAIAAAALSWAAGARAARPVVLAWLVFTGTGLTLTALQSADNLPIQITMHVLPFLAAAAWAGHHAAETTHLAAAQLRAAELDAATQRAIAHERLQLARDLHDAASHAVGTMMMQANAARVLRERDPDGARAALDAIAEVGAATMAELRALRCSASRAAGAPPELADDLRALAAAAERTGSRVRVDLYARGDVAEDDGGLIRRIVREGLANAVRHAPGSDVAVSVEITPARIGVRIRNAAPTGGPAGATGSGLGLRGLRELVDERGGRLSAAPEGDGFLLVAAFAPRSARMVAP